MSTKSAGKTGKTRKIGNAAKAGADKAKLSADRRATRRNVDVKEPVYTGYVIVHFIDDSVPADGDGKSLFDFAVKHGIDPLATYLKDNKLDNPEASFQLIHRTSLAALKAREDKAAKSERPPLLRLTGFWRIDMRNRPEDQVKQLVAELGRKDNPYKLDVVYRETGLSLAAVNADPLSATSVNPSYVDGNGDGINARFTWALPTSAAGTNIGAGEGIGFADVEEAWIEDHQDLLGRPVLLPGHTNRRASDSDAASHGTACLGIVVGQVNNLGITGIAPNVASVLLASSIGQLPTDVVLPNDLADAIADVTESTNPQALQPGDVLLLEVQTSQNFPVESGSFGALTAEYIAISLATSEGFIVIEAAGNAGSDVGPGIPPDSGAILVGAGRSAKNGNGHDRWPGSNFGTRVNCYAWGESVTACGCGYPLVPPTPCDNLLAGTAQTTYTQTFGGTSAASAIIAGAALVVQGLVVASGKPRLTGTEMRTRLSASATGTPCSLNAAIGVMPDLGKIHSNLPIFLADRERMAMRARARSMDGKSAIKPNKKPGKKSMALSKDRLSAKKVAAPGKATKSAITK